MSDATEGTETKSVKKSSKKSSAKKAAPKAERAPSGTKIAKLYELLKKAGAKQGLSTAKKLAAGCDVTKKELVALRDHVNAAAITARENNAGSLASQLSALNRSVRRMARTA